MPDLMPYYRQEVQGTQELIDSLNAFEDKEVRVMCRKALKEASLPIMEAIGSTSAYQDETGLLRSSDHATAGRGDRPGITSILIRWYAPIGDVIERFQNKGFSDAKVADMKRLLLSKYYGNIGAKYRTFYAVPLEMGHEPSGWYAKQANAEPVPAHSFARTSFDATVDAAAEIAQESLADQISSALE